MLWKLDCIGHVEHGSHELRAGVVILEPFFYAEKAGRSADEAIFIAIVLVVELLDHQLHLFVSFVTYRKGKERARRLGIKSHDVLVDVLVYEAADQKISQLSSAKAVEPVL